MGLGDAKVKHIGHCLQISMTAVIKLINENQELKTLGIDNYIIDFTVMIR